MNDLDRAAPRPTLSVLDGIGLVVGVVIGIGIFRTPSLVASNVDSAFSFMGLWLAGGLITLAGAAVYAELASRYPSAGGEYTFLSRGIGRPMALLFAWARISVIQTGASAAVAFVFGDYAQAVLPLGEHGGPIYAALVLAAVTAVNLRGTLHGKTAQNLLSALTFLAILAIVLVGLVAGAPAAPRVAAEPAAGGALGLAMVFILLTYGGWNEAAYISADVRDGRRAMLRVLLFGTVLIMAVYLVANLAYLRVLGLDGMRESSAVAADLMQRTVGPIGAAVISLAICLAALSTLNASIFTGARVYHALGTDLPALRAIGTWDADGNNPRRAMLVQSGIALVLVLFGAAQRDGFQAIVEYTAPVFWFFMLMVGIAYFVLRHRDAHAPRLLTAPFLYPAVPLVFCAACAWLLYSSLVHTGLGGLVGVAVLAAGVPLILLAHRHGRQVVPAE